MGKIAPPRPLTENDDRETFDCGREFLNQWFRRNAWRNQRDSTSRTTVLCDAETGAIAGYVTLTTAQVERQFFPKPQQRNRPDPLPALLLGQLGVDIRYQGRGISKSLMQYALQTAMRVSADIGCFAVLTHPIDDEVRAFYARYGFADLPQDPKRAMYVRIDELQKAGFGR